MTQDREGPSDNAKRSRLRHLELLGAVRLVELELRLVLLLSSVISMKKNFVLKV